MVSVVGDQLSTGNRQPATGNRQPATWQPTTHQERVVLIAFPMAKPTVADFLVRRLQAWGVNRIYGYPGDRINGVMGALERAGEAMHFVQVRQEEMAGF